MIFWAAGLVATVLLTLCFAARQVKYGRVRAAVAERNGSGRPGGAEAAEDGAISGVPRKRGAAESAEPRSRKQDRRNQVGHGLGLRSVERTVHGCGGELAVESREGQFTVAVRLPKQ